MMTAKYAAKSAAEAQLAAMQMRLLGAESAGESDRREYRRYAAQAESILSDACRSGQLELAVDRTRDNKELLDAVLRRQFFMLLVVSFATLGLLLAASRKPTSEQGRGSDHQTDERAEERIPAGVGDQR